MNAGITNPSDQCHAGTENINEQRTRADRIRSTSSPTNGGSSIDSVHDPIVVSEGRPYRNHRGPAETERRQPLHLASMTYANTPAAMTCVDVRRERSKLRKTDM